MFTVSRVTAHLIVVVSAGCVLAACKKSDSVSADSDGGAEDASAPSDSDGAAAIGGTSGQSGSGGKLGTGGRSGSGGQSNSGGTGGRSGSGGQSNSSGTGGQSGSGGGAGVSGAGYTGPTVGSAKRFAVLAYDSVTTANTSAVVGDIGVSDAAISVITGFDDAAYTKYGNDSLAPNDGLTGLAQGDVTQLVGNIDPRACDNDLTNVVGGLTGDITLHPGVTCMNSFSADILINGHVYLDAGGDRNAFFVIRGRKALNVADGAQIVLTNEARTCGVFWQLNDAVTIGKTVEFHGTIVAGTAITMKSGSTLHGRALARTAGVQLDDNTINAPSDGDCPHLQ